ncbi:MAG: histidine phosphatase family protein [Gaiellaceae bacterium]
MRLVLCRHAAMGSSDQAAGLSRELEDLQLAALYTSPLVRALETAQVVAAVHPLTPSIRADLREIDLGAVEGLPFEEYPLELQAELLDSPASVRFPGGESYDELRARVVTAFDEIAATHADKTVVAISHAGAIRAALATWLDIPAGAAFRIEQSFAAINVVDLNGAKPFLRLVNGATIPAALRAAL